MELIFVLAAVLFFVWLVRRSETVDAPDWLRQRWKRLARAQRRGEIGPDLVWYFLKPTARQLEFARELGIGGSLVRLTRGQVSDLIGLQRAPGRDEEAQFRAAGIILEKGASETWAREQLSLFNSSPEHRMMMLEAAAEARASSFDRAALNFAGVAVPPKLKNREVGNLLSQAVAQGANAQARFDWFCTVARGLLEDGDVRAAYGIRKPRLKQVKDAISHLESEDPEHFMTRFHTDHLVDVLVDRDPVLVYRRK